MAARTTAARIVVLGAGYAGLAAAKGISRRARTGATDVEVTLVNARDTFTERVRLHQVAAGQSLRTAPLARLLGDAPVRLVVGRAVAIDAGAREIALADGTRLPYDTLVYAPGSRADTDTVPGVAAHGWPLAEAEDAARLRARLDGPPAGDGTVAVVGGGLTGIEAATELAESRPELKVTLLTGGRLGATLSTRGRRHLLRVFARLGIDLREHARVAEIRADGAVLDDGSHVPAGTVVWTTGFRVPELAREAGFGVDGDGRLRVDASLRSVSHPEVYGIGDAAAVRHPGGQELRMACATGLPAARHLARVLAAEAGRAGRAGRAGPAGRRAPGPMPFRYLNQCISLGRRDALVQYVRADDSPHEAVLTGRLAALYKETIVRGALAAQRRPALLPLLSPRSLRAPR